MSQITKKTVIRIRYALSEEPLFLFVDDTQKTVQTILREAVDKLEAIGKAHEAIQLSNVLRDHHVFMAGSRVDSATRIEGLTLEERELSGEQIQYGELQLLREHKGGAKSLAWWHWPYPLVRKPSTDTNETTG